MNADERGFLAGNEKTFAGKAKVMIEFQIQKIVLF